ncbi:hypothetical protein OESDEN_14544 [Oesophagostomum dentatum]|uniref:Uncharacterized protein n=1 Tax=Oesophagostomum dentatum TaxID=61180 RepID=A0A0B1SQD7_OESDE|nr:hypothetical protein OESDEN_14544 [Oesophagostomum dentatum]
MGEFKVTERDFTMDELRKGLKENRIYELFGAGTAAVVTPIDTILYQIDGHEEKLTFPPMKAEKSLVQRLVRIRVFKIFKF